MQTFTNANEFKDLITLDCFTDEPLAQMRFQEEITRLPEHNEYLYTPEYMDTPDFTDLQESFKLSFTDEQYREFAVNHLIDSMLTESEISEEYEGWEGEEIFWHLLQEQYTTPQNLTSDILAELEEYAVYEIHEINGQHQGDWAKVYAEKGTVTSEYLTNLFFNQPIYIRAEKAGVEYYISEDFLTNEYEYDQDIVKSKVAKSDYPGDIKTFICNNLPEYIY